MPYLRFSRNECGYEHTYVLHAARGEGRSKPRLLYWFRTPPGVRVGRHPLDEEAIRAIEERNPDLSFDWSRMREAQPPPAPEPERRGKAARGGRKAGSRRTGRAAPADGGGGSGRGARDRPPPEPPAAVDLPPAAEADEPAEPWRHPVVTLMGEEMLERLRARYAEIKVRIGEQRLDPPARGAMLTRAEALDPDGWDTVEDAVRGIERFDAQAEAIRGDLGRRPPRARRAGSGADESAA